MKTIVLWKLIVLFGFLLEISSFKFNFGNCPVYFEEPCTQSTKFILSTGKSNNVSYHDLHPLQPILPKDYNIFVPLKVVVHGYGGLSVDSATTNVTKAYQDVGYNVIIVDWETLSSLPCYFTAYLNTWHVGQCLAILAVNLLSYGITPSLTHVIGFSLGAHIAGFAGSKIKNTLGISFMRITGLDPALPFFVTLKNEWKLDPSDATFVDVIHTSAGTFGKLEAIGDVDFYMNGGSLQPFCYNAKYPPICSHVLAGLYFAETIKHPKGLFLGSRCDSVVNYYFGFCESGDIAAMGEYTHFSVRGLYFVKTSNNPPFALTLINY